MAASVADVVSVHGGSLSGSQTTDVLNFCDVVKDRISRLPLVIRGHKYVEGCKQLLASTAVSLAAHQG
ncbi:hypothetical protein D3C79_1098880 [compost metagenome]